MILVRQKGGEFRTKSCNSSKRECVQKKKGPEVCGVYRERVISLEALGVGSWVQQEENQAERTLFFSRQSAGKGTGLKTFFPHQLGRWYLRLKKGLEF